MRELRYSLIHCVLASFAAVLFITTPAAAQDPKPPEPQTQPAPPTDPQSTSTQTQTPPPEPQPPSTTAVPPQTPNDQTNPSAPPPSILSGAAGASYDRRDSLPNINVYLPEGTASIRLRKLIRNVLFESQIDYKFIEGDISTFLRYKYYAHGFTYKLSVFDTIQFPDPGSSDTQPFERVRGGLVLFEFPRDYNKRYYWLIQDDRLTFGNHLNVDDRKNNVYTKVSYQYGTEFDERMNAIVGESRGRITPVLTAFRELGPQNLSFAAALTLSGKVGTGDYQYARFESEILKRFDLSTTTFLVSRAHIGFIPWRQNVCPNLIDGQCYSDGGELLQPIERYSIPRYELFGLGGRESLRSVRDNPDSEGTHEFHFTNEYFFPVFRNRDFRTYALHWNTMYGTAYLGAGSVAFDTKNLAKSANTVIDVGLGGETSLTLRDFNVILSLLYARGISAPSCPDPKTDPTCRDLKNGRILFSIRTVR